MARSPASMLISPVWLADKPPAGHEHAVDDTELKEPADRLDHWSSGLPTSLKIRHARRAGQPGKVQPVGRSLAEQVLGRTFSATCPLKVRTT